RHYTPLQAVREYATQNDPGARGLQQPAVLALPCRRTQLRGKSRSSSADGIAEIKSDVLHIKRVPRHRAQCGGAKPRQILEARIMRFRAIGINRFFQISSGLIILGLLAEIVSLLWFHPLAFVLFA